jgi:acetyltransferase EpsM
MSQQTRQLHVPLQTFDPTAILVYGGGGHGKAIIDVIRAMRTYRVIGIIDDNIPAGTLILGVPVLGTAQILGETYRKGIRLAANGVGGIGNVDIRLKAFEMLAESGFVCPALVHPSAVIEPSAVLESGVQVLAQAYIGGDVQIGFGTLFNIGACAAHDCKIGKVVNLSPQATLAGGVMVDDYTQIGMCATVNVNLKIGSRVRIGNGATVKADVASGMRIRAGEIYPSIMQGETHVP